MPKCPFCEPTHERNKQLSGELAALRSLLREAMQEWGHCTRGTDSYTIKRYKNFLKRKDVRAVLEEKP